LNRFEVGAEPVKQGYLGWFRRVEKARNQILRDGRGDEIVFPSLADAKAAAADALCSYLNGGLRSTGLMPRKHRAEAEALFRDMPDVPAQVQAAEEQARGDE
jgi:hypothetical protein